MEKEKVDLKARNRKLFGQVESLEASIMKNKALVEDVEACMSHNIDLHAELKEKDEDLKKTEEARKEAMELAEKRAKELEDSCVALLAYMQEAKVAIDIAFVKGGVESRRVLLEADPATFLAWLQAELGQFSQLLESVTNFGAYGATLAIARSF